MLKKLSFLIAVVFLMMNGQAIAADFETGGENPTDDSVIYYFGYGSNLDETYFKQYTPSVKRVTTAHLPNFEIQFRSYSANLDGGLSSIIPKAGGLVEGVIYTIDKKEIEALDILEDVPLGVHIRETFKVISPDGKWYNADLYYVAEPKGPFTPSIKYLGYMINGAKVQGINQPWIDYLEALREEVIKGKEK